MNDGMFAQGGSAQGRKKIITEQFDVLVVGGGPAGLMAAGRAAEKGARVALVEKNDRYGIKLLMTGNGRCNVTQQAEDMFEFVKSFKNGRFLLSAFKKMGPEEVREFFDSRGVATKVEKNGKVFPVSDQGKDVLDALYQYCRENMVTFFNSEEVIGIEKTGNKIIKIITKKKEISAERYILATGGKSYPSTGSNGKGFDWAEKLGHKISETEPSLVPILIKEQKIKDAQGLSAHNVSMTAICEGKKVATLSGDLMFAHFGLSGPLALNISRDVRKVLPKGEVRLLLDLKPQLSIEQVDEIIRKDFEAGGNKNLGSCLKDFVSPKMFELILSLSGLDHDKHASKISRQDRLKIAGLLKRIEMTVEGLFGFEKAMVTTGGVSTKEIESETMKSKLIENLYFAGEIIDVDGPTGGYNLQACWATGFVAGENAASSVLEF